MMAAAAGSTRMMLWLTEQAAERGATGLLGTRATVRLVHTRWWQSPAVRTVRTVELVELHELLAAVSERARIVFGLAS